MHLLVQANEYLLHTPARVGNFLAPQSPHRVICLEGRSHLIHGMDISKERPDDDGVAVAHMRIGPCRLGLMLRIALRI